MKYLYFMEETDGAFDALNDAVCRPVSAFKGFGIIASTTTLEMHFDNLLENAQGGHAGAIDKVVLTVTANKQKEIMSEIVREINKGGGDDFIVVSDDSNSDFLSAHITGCAITVTAAG